jgi:hypothetical protein
MVMTHGMSATGESVGRSNVTRVPT